MALLVVDNRPLQQAAWAELVSARKRLEKASREIHRHEQTDEPGYRQWMLKLFPALLSSVRELAQQVEAKGRLIEAVESEAFFTRRRPDVVWREMKNPRPKPEFPPPGAREADERSWDEQARKMSEAEALEEEMRRMFEREGIDENDPVAEAFREASRTLFGAAGTREAAPVEAEARAIYRRLVQHLHPDRGGAWTPSRARLWEQVQQAWQEHDVDWLARLEAEWEASADLLGPASAVGRLRAACREIDAARRDAERRVRSYRKTAWWRFSLRRPSDELRDAVEREFRWEQERLRRELNDIEATIARWENVRPRRRRAVSRPMSAAWQDGMPLF